MSRSTWTRRDLRAWCQDCGKEWFSKNAQWVAAQHCDRHAHVVHVEIAMGVSYYPPGREPKNDEPCED